MPYDSIQKTRTRELTVRYDANNTSARNIKLIFSAVMRIL